MNIEYTKYNVLDIIEQIKNDEISPNTLDASGRNIFDILIDNDIGNAEIYKLLVDKHWSVDRYNTSSATPITHAIRCSALPHIEMLLKYHEKNTMSDYDILISAVNSDDTSFNYVMANSKLLNPNSTRYRGSHVLHTLVEDDWFMPRLEYLYNVFKDEIILNPIHRKGYSPLTKAINSSAEQCATFLSIHGGKIIGEIEIESNIVDYELVDVYNSDNRNFFKDYPDMMSYAINHNKMSGISNDLQNIFLL